MPGSHPPELPEALLLAILQLLPPTVAAVSAKVVCKAAYACLGRYKTVVSRC